MQTTEEMQSGDGRRGRLRIFLDLRLVLGKPTVC